MAVVQHGTGFFSLLADRLRCLCGESSTASIHYESMRHELVSLRSRSGRLLIIGVGGGAANAAHAVCDFRKLCGIEAYAPTDSTAELTARANDEGLDTIFTEWLRTSRFSHQDALMVFSVGGGHAGVSQCISHAVEYAHAVGAPILGVVGRDDGTTARLGTSVITVGGGEFITPLAETMQVAVLHALVTDPSLRINECKW